MYKEPDIAASIKSRRLKFISHVMRDFASCSVKKVTEEFSNRKIPLRRHTDNIHQDLQMLERNVWESINEGIH